MATTRHIDRVMELIDEIFPVDPVEDRVATEKIKRQLADELHAPAEPAMPVPGWGLIPPVSGG